VVHVKFTLDIPIDIRYELLPDRVWIKLSSGDIIHIIVIIKFRTKEKMENNQCALPEQLKGGFYANSVAVTYGKEEFVIGFQTDHSGREHGHCQTDRYSGPY